MMKLPRLNTLKILWLWNYTYYVKLYDYGILCWRCSMSFHPKRHRSSPGAARYRVFFQVDPAGSEKSQVDTDQPPGAESQMEDMMIEDVSICDYETCCEHIHVYIYIYISVNMFIYMLEDICEHIVNIISECITYICI